MAKKPTTTEQRVVLPNVSWQQFEQLLVELGAERQARLTYARGNLELMTPIEEHDRCNKLIESLLLVLADELALPLTPVMPILLKQPQLGCATEPDACYYAGSPPAIAGEIDLTQDPAPDLLVEVAFTKSAIDKLPLYAAMAIPEVWRYLTTPGDQVLKGQLIMYRLADQRYLEQPTSAIFPFLTAQRVLEFLEQSDAISLAAALRLLRSWIKDQAP